MAKYLSTACAVALCACSGGGGGGDGGNHGSGSISGTIDGQTFSVASVASANTTNSYSLIALSSSDDFCGQITSNEFDRNEQILQIYVFGQGSGEYDVMGAPLARVFAVNMGSDCQNYTANVVGSGGTVDVASITGSGSDVFAGMFDVMFTTGDHITGDFSSVSCPAYAEGFDPGSAATCN